MKNIPKKLSICGVKYRIQPEKSLDEGTVLGKCCDRTKTISLSDENSDSVALQQTFLHEILHAIWSETGLAHQLDEKFEHSLIDSLERHLHPLMETILRVKK